MANTPDTPSADYEAMRPYLEKVEAILGGHDAMIAAGETYLPKFPDEPKIDYAYRLKTSKFTNIFADIVASLAAKPFSEEVVLADEDVSERIAALAKNIDGKGNDLHSYAAATFHEGVAKAVDWIFVEFTKVRPRLDGRPLSLADEKAQGLRPYWVHIPATSMLAVYSDFIGGEEVFTHARWREVTTRREGFDEVTVERVRELDREPVIDATGQVTGYAPAVFRVWEKREPSGVGRFRKAAWEIVDEGVMSIGVIPLVPFATGKRKGRTWRFEPQMRDIADLQIKHFQAETALWSIKEMTAFPMLSGNGVQPPMVNGEPAPVPVGPRRVLYAPPIMSQNSASHGEWSFIEPNATSLTFLSGEIDKMEQQLRELGRQPLTAQTGNLTVVTTAFAAQKGNSAVQAWALNLKAALERALKLTAMWLHEDAEPTVKVFTDFAIEAGDDKGPEWLKSMAERGRLSRATEWEEAKRRNILSADFDPEAEDERLAAEAEEAIEEDEARAALGTDEAIRLERERAKLGAGAGPDEDEAA